MNGHLEMLKWARSQGCPWDAETSLHAANSGHLEVLKWARSQGCPWDKADCLYEAEVNMYVDVADWIRAQED